MPKAMSTGQKMERDTLAKELEVILPQLKTLSLLISPPSGMPSSPEDASHGWEQYRALALKLSRLATRIEELAGMPGAPSAATSKGAKQDKRSSIKVGK